MFIITENGDKLNVDTSTVNYEEGWHPWYQVVAAVDDDSTHLSDVWIVELQKMGDRHSFNNFEMEWFKEVYLQHEPTQDEIMGIIIRAGGDSRTVAFVRHGYVIDIEYD